MSSINGVKNSETYGSEESYLDNPSDIPSGESDDFGIEDEFGVDGSDQDLGNLESNGSITVLDLHQQLRAFLKDLTPAQNEQFKAQIESIKKELSGLRSNSIAPAHLVEGFASIQGELMSGDSLDGEPGMEGMDGTVSQQVEALKAQVGKNDKLDEATKQALLDKLTDVAAIESISPEQAQEKLDTISEEVQNYTMYSPAAMRLDKKLGTGDPAAVQEMLDKHGIDGAAKDINPAKLTDVLNDPLIAESVAAEQEAHDTAYKTMNDMVPTKISEAHAANQATDQKDSSMILDTDTSSFKWLYETKMGTSAEAKNTIATANALAEKKASIISALTNTEVQVNPKDPGIIQLPTGGAFNAVKNKLGGPAIEWQSFDLPEFHADCEGDGMTAFPEWMKQAKYPYHSTDNGGISFAAVFLTILGAGMVGVPGANEAYIGSVAGVGATGGFEYTPEDPYAPSGN